MTTGVSAPRAKMDYKARGRLLIHLFLLIGCVVMIFPFLWMIVTSFKSIGESLLIPPTLLPKVWLTENYTEVLRTLPFGAPDEVRREVRFMIDTYFRPDGRFILAAGNNMTPDTPLGSLDALLDESMRYGARAAARASRFAAS